MVTYGGEQSLGRYLALSARGAPFNVAHAVGNFAFALAAGPALVRMISRYRTRLQFTWHPAGALPLLLLTATILLSAHPWSDPPAADAQRSMRAAGVQPTERWLFSQQNPDGGYGASQDFDSSPAMTGWTMMGLEAAGVNPLDVAKRGRTPVDYLREHASRLRSTNDLERTILALEGAGVNTRNFGGNDLVAELRSRRSRDGSVNGQVNLTAFFALAMRAAGTGPGELSRPARWLREAQNGDGGWGFNPGAPSDPDSTGAALQGLAAAGATGRASADGVRWLGRVQRGGGGWGLATTGIVNTQSTAWAVQGLIAADSGGGALRKGLAYIERQRVADGHYRYSAATDQTPIWVTAQALLAVEREPLPLPVVARAPRPGRTGGDRHGDGDGPGAPGAGDQPQGTDSPPTGGGPDGGEDRTTEEGNRAGRDGRPASADGADGAPAAPAGEGVEAGTPPATQTEPAMVSAEAPPPSSTTTSGDGDETIAFVVIGTVVAALGAGYWARRQRSSAAR
jgi:hypothetical protein